MEVITEVARSFSPVEAERVRGLIAVEELKGLAETTKRRMDWEGR